MSLSDEVEQDFLLGLHVFEESVLAVQTQVEAYICRHVLQRVIDGHFYLADHATLIGGAVYFEHPSEGRIGIGAAVVSELRLTAWNVVIEDMSGPISILAGIRVMPCCLTMELFQPLKSQTWRIKPNSPNVDISVLLLIFVL